MAVYAGTRYLGSSDTQVDSTDVRATALRMLHRSQAAHLGTSMSIIEILVAVFSSIDIAAIRQQRSDRSRVIVSKGHGAAAVYATMGHFGLIDFDLLDTYHQNGSLLAGHVSHAVEAVEHSTGALGHGLPVACGCAIGLRTRDFRDSQVFVIVGDGELQEGSNWEALQLMSHLRLSNLIVLVDNNRISSITNTRDVINMEPLAQRFSGYGLAAHEVDGHDVEAIRQCIAVVRESNQPSVIVCNTVKGYGVPFAEGKPVWHYRSLGAEDYETAIAALQGAER